MQIATRYILSWTAFALGALALLASIIHFWAGPIDPPPSLEHVVADRAVAIRDATVARLAGREAPAPEATQRSWSNDRMLTVTVVTLGALSLVLAVAGFARGEPRRVAVGAAFLGASAIAFQLFTVVLGVIVVLVLVALVLGALGFS